MVPTVSLPWCFLGRTCILQEKFILVGGGAKQNHAGWWMINMTSFDDTRGSLLQLGNIFCEDQNLPLCHRGSLLPFYGS